jgi:crotonobetainyl-CoA:carnitine CoA-transferase CaiB-like acyl-CoA transferase
VAPILEPAEAATDEQYRYRKVFVEARHPTAGLFSQVGPVLAGMPAVREPVELPDPETTQTGELLEAAGMPTEKVAEMRNRGVLA